MRSLLDYRQDALTASANLRSLETQRTEAASAYAGLLEQSVAGNADEAKVAAAKATLRDLDVKLSAARELVNVREADLLVAEQAKAAAKAMPVEPATVRDNRIDDPKYGFSDHRDYLGAVMGAARGKTDDRLRMLATVGSDEQGAYSDPYGGFLVPRGVVGGLLALRPESDPIAALTTKIPMSSPSVVINARVDKTHTSSVSGGLTVARRAETAQMTSSRMSFEQITLNANELYGFAYATERILTDSAESFIALLSAGFSDEFGAKAMDDRLNGSGVGEPLGILHASNAAKVSVAKETGQAADTIVKENIDKMVSRSWRYGSSVWLANHDCRPQLMGLSQAVGTGGAPVAYFTGSPGGQEYLFNRPIFFSEFAKTVGDAGDLILADWSQYLEATYQPLRSDESIHVRFDYGERAFRFYLRNDGKPWWTAALTPRVSTATLSPFVVLAAR